MRTRGLILCGLQIIIVGAGPAGLVLALLLAKANIKIEILEAASALDQSPRATHYSYPALHELKRAGLLDEIRERGFVTDGEVAWRRLDGSLITQINGSALPIDYRLHALPLNRLCKLVYEHIEREPNCEVKFSHKVLSIDQDKPSAEVLVETPDGTQVTMKADYIIGCDGANSQIRRSLFGDMNFPGRTWDEQIVATNVSRIALKRIISSSLIAERTRAMTGLLRYQTIRLGTG
jgi:2-polyprenyl-6-methoxyphenol hydroxylase-like FAD-dependent oxidoreductase